MSWSGTSFVPIFDNTWLEKEHGIQAGNFLQLAELDVIYPSELSLRLFREDTIVKEHFFYGPNILVVERNEIKSETQLGCWKFTNTGAELLALVPKLNDVEFLERLGTHLIQRKAKASLATVRAYHSDGRVSYDISREVVTNDEAT